MVDAESYASGNWRVKEGNEEEFISRWVDFLEWTRDNAEGFGGATLIRDQEDPRNFVSFAPWADAAAQDAWRELPEFPQKFGACRELCEEARGATYGRVASV
jgi:heme-degrading monooxygenase HmoA